MRKRSGFIDAGRVLTPNGFVGPARVAWSDGVITGVEPLATAPDVVLAPGFVDLQVNGIDDVDVATADEPGWALLDARLLDQGVTAWCPTLITSPLDAYGPQLRAIAAAAARDDLAPRPLLAGAHLEGPFLGGAPGAHRRSLVRPLDLDWLAALPPIVRVVTLAPEQASAEQAIRLLASRNVTVSLGHSTATAHAARAAMAAGASLVTHLFNGMGPIHHREPGLALAALVDDRVAVCLIADLVHVHPDAIRLAFAAKSPSQVVLVTDAVAWRSGTAGPVRLKLGADGAPRLNNGTLAGSALAMDQAVRNVVEHCGIALEHALVAASANPARIIGLGSKGAIACGADADLVTLDQHLAVAAVHVRGRQVR